MWKRPPTKRGRVEFADEGRGREASSLSVFVLGYAWQSVTAKKAAGVAGYACARAVSYLSVYNVRHWVNDVVGGAAIGGLIGDQIGK